MIFTELPMCKNRLVCYACRNVDKFRERMQRQHGDWECPDNIQIGTPLQDLPESAVDYHNKMSERQERHKEKIAEAEIALNDLEMIVPENGKYLLNKIRNVFFANSKTVGACKHGGEIIGKTDESCCGGKIKSVDEFACKKHGSTTNKKCIRCEDFEHV